MAFNGTNVQGRAGGNFLFRGRHNFGHGLVALREQPLVPGLNLFYQVGKLSGSNFRCDYHAPNRTPFPVGRREPFNLVLHWHKKRPQKPFCSTSSWDLVVARRFCASRRGERRSPQGRTPFGPTCWLRLCRAGLLFRNFLSVREGFFSEVMPPCPPWPEKT